MDQIGIVDLIMIAAAGIFIGELAASVVLAIVTEIFNPPNGLDH